VTNEQIKQKSIKFWIISLCILLVTVSGLSMMFFDMAKPSLAVALPETPTPELDVSSASVLSPDIVGGEEAAPGAWPWQVALIAPSRVAAGGLGRPPIFKNAMFCGGSLIDEQWIVTAAHCVVDSETGQFPAEHTKIEIVAGIHNIYWPADGYQRRRLSLGGIIPYQEYVCNPTLIDGSYQCNGDNYNDIALLRLENPVNINNIDSAARTQIVTLAESTSNDFAGRRAFVTGWGDMNPDSNIKDYPNTLQEVIVPVITNVTCNSSDQYNGIIVNQQLCAGYLAGWTDSCQGDSGGPLVVLENNIWVQIGIVSWGEGCAQPNKPGVYSRVSSYREWIRCQMSLCASRLEQPDNNSTASVRPTFDWFFDYRLNSYQPDHYMIEISRNPSFQPSEITAFTEGNYFIPEHNLAAGATYYWRVQSLRGNESGPLSETWQFTTASNPPPPATVTPVPGDTTPPTAGNYTASPSGSTANLSVTNANDASGIREVRFSAKFNNRWIGIGNDTTAPYDLAWNMCDAGVPDGDVELGMEVWDNAGNVYIWSQHYPNPHINKAYNCNQTQFDDGIHLYPNDGLDPSRGGVCKVTQDAPSIGNYCGGSWNDDVESVRTVGPYRAVLFKDDWYGGGEPLYIDFTAALPTEWRNQASSIRIRRTDNPAFTLYSLGDYNGESWPSDRTIYDMGHWRWNDKAQSIRVHAGYSVIVCSDADFKSVCGRATGPAQWSDINALAQGLRDGVSSIRVCPGSCPDAGPPSTLNYPVNNQSADATQPVILRWSGALNQFYVELWGGGIDGRRQYGWTNDVSWNVGMLPASDQPYYWHIKGWRGYGETGWTDGSFYVAVPDSTPPTGTMTLPGRFGYRNGPTTTLKASVSDIGSGVDRVEFFAWLSDKWEFLGTDSTSPYEYEWDISAVRESGLWVSANIVDKAGNNSGLIWDPEWVFFTIDHTPPSSAVLALPTTQTDPQFTVRWRGSDNYTPSDLVLYEVEYQLDCTGEWLGWFYLNNLEGASFTGEVGHAYCFRSRAQDLPGNTEAWPDTADARIYIADPTVPTPTPTATPLPPDVTPPTATPTSTSVPGETATSTPTDAAIPVATATPDLSVPGSKIYLPLVSAKPNSTPTPILAPNLAPNPSFEAGSGDPTGWISERRNGTMAFEWDSTAAHSGNRALAIKNFTPGPCTDSPSPSCADGQWMTSQLITIDPTHDYELSAWYRNTTGTDRVAFLAIMWANNDSYALGSTGLWRMAPTNDWAYRTVVISAADLQKYFPGVQRVQLSFSHFIEQNDGGGIWLDDIVFRDVTK